MIINEFQKRILHTMWLLLVILLLGESNGLLLFFVVAVGDFLMDRSIEQWNKSQHAKHTALPISD
jgi:uncharacterized membrane protein YesL